MEKSEVQYLIQPKVSFDEMKNYVEQVNAVRYAPLQDDVEEKLKPKKVI